MKKRSIVPAECHNGSPVGFLQTTENHKILATIHPALYTHAAIVAQLYSIMQWIEFNSEGAFLITQNTYYEFSEDIRKIL